MKRWYTKKDMARELFSWLLYGAGALRRYQLDPTYPWQRLVFVCEGNICRSAYAEWKAKSLGLSAASFGLSALDDGPADPKATEIAGRMGVDLSPHRGTHINSYEPHPRDLIACMEIRHAKEVRKRLPEVEHCIVLPTIVDSPIILDPFGRPDSYFEKTFATLDIAVEKLASMKNHRTRDNLSTLSK